MQKKVSLVLLIIVLVACGSEQSTTEVQLESDNPITVQEEITTTSTSITSTTTTTTYVCIEENNLNIDFDNLKNVQNFLNRYGYNAGEEDGYLGAKTISAIKEFQTYAGLNPDGDVGPATKRAMNNWTGCEEKATPYVKDDKEETQNTSSESSTTSSTTTTTTTTTTTLPPSDISTNIEASYGYTPSVSLTTNQIANVFKGVEDSTSICGAPYINNLDSESINLYQNGKIQYSAIQNAIYTESTSTAEIVNVTSNSFSINVIGNGDLNFKFYFIKPFESNLVELTPSSISTSPGLTTAIFDKTNLDQGYWFFSFAENSSGQIVKSAGLREILISEDIVQTQNSDNEIDTIFFLKNKQNISKGLNINDSNDINIIYTTKNIYDSRSNTTNEISGGTNVITLANENQAIVGEVLHIGRELMLVTGKDGSNFTVERGYLGTQNQSHSAGSVVRAIENPSKQSVKSSFAYAVIRSESGIKYQVALGRELSTNNLSTSKCPNGLYSFEEITIFSWRPQGSSVGYSSTKLDRNNPIFDKQFLINNSYNYSPPTLLGTSTDGDFINEGPKNTNVSTGEKVIFNFSGLTPGTSTPKFVEIKFTMNPYGSSDKLSKTRSIFFDITDNFVFEIEINQITSSSAIRSNTWESGYKYTLDSFIVYDEASKTIFRSNQDVTYDYTSNKSTHDAYYLDQFIFNIP